METKKDDVRYCDVSLEHIVNMLPVINWENMKLFHHYLIERYKIHTRKDVEKLPKPWTDDPVLRNYKFTNVRREHDKQTKYLIDNIVMNSSLSIEDKIYNIFLFRAWNNWETMKYFGGPWKASSLSLYTFKEDIKKTSPDLSRGQWYSNAYNQGGTKLGLKNAVIGDNSTAEKQIPYRPFHIGPWLKEKNVVNRMLHSSNQKECFEIIKEIPGFADFLAYQVFVDCTYIKEFPFSENEFVVAGPGCKNGLDKLFDKPEDVSYEELLFYFRDNLPDLFCVVELSVDEKFDPLNLFYDIPLEDRNVNIMSLENCMCEFSKYKRTVNGTGRPKNTYQGGK